MSQQIVWLSHVSLSHLPCVMRHRVMCHKSVATLSLCHAPLQVGCVVWSCVLCYVPLHVVWFGHVACVMCHVFCVMYHCRLCGLVMWLLSSVMFLVSNVMCHVSNVMCHVSCVLCLVSCVLRLVSNV